MTTKTLNAMPYAQAKIVTHDDGCKFLISYKTVVIDIDRDGWVTVHGLYSATTRRHIGAFMREVLDMDYQAAKMFYEKGWRYNMNTGEVADRVW